METPIDAVCPVCHELVVSYLDYPTRSRCVSALAEHVRDLHPLHYGE